ncbi:MAG: L,D-transpeptidase [Cyanobacteria bacterium J06582_2]
MSTLDRNKRNILAIASLLLLTPVVYWTLNQIGFVPPVNYFFPEANKQNASNPIPVQSTLLNYEQPINELISPQIDRSLSKILVDKSNYQLTLYYDSRPIKSYPIVLGQSPQGDKRREGDLKTPEGIFKIRDLYPHPAWSKFIWLDYPNQESWRKHLQAKQDGKISLNSTVGSEIGIHGVPKNGDYLVDERSNWTWGCISLKNQDVDEIYRMVQVGTTIKIIP